MSILLEKFLIRNNYTKFNKRTISQQLQTHPENPSFLAMTDTLDYFEIANVAANVPEEALEVLPKNFLTTIGIENPELVLATKKSNLIVTENEKGIKKKFPANEFKEVWSKNIIAIEKTNVNYSLNLIKDLWIVIPIVLLIIFFILTSPSLFQILTLVLAGIGGFVSFLLVKEKVGYHSELVLSVCTALENSNCNEVINSEAGQITEDISLADASFLYFVCLFFASISLGSNLIISGMILAALPVILFTVYYQGFVLRKWCVLCFGVVLVVVLLNVTLIWDFTFSLNPTSIVVFLIVLSLIIPIYFLVKDFIILNKDMEQEIITARKFKRNPEIVKNILKDAEPVQNISMLEKEIIIGNKNAKHSIIAYTNPLCGFCEKAFESYLRIINSNSDIQILMRFSADPNKLESPVTKITFRLMEIYWEKDSENFIEAYSLWFKNKDISKWFKKYGNPKFEENLLLSLNYHKQWAKENNIDFTPLTIINNRVFPSTYGYEDLAYVINDMLETSP